MDNNFDKHTLREVHFTAWLKNGKVENNGTIGLVGYFHQWGNDVILVEDGKTAPVTVGILETELGQVYQALPDHMFFRQK